VTELRITNFLNSPPIGWPYNLIALNGLIRCVLNAKLFVVASLGAASWQTHFPPSQNHARSGAASGNILFMDKLLGRTDDPRNPLLLAQHQEGTETLSRFETIQHLKLVLFFVPRHKPHKFPALLSAWYWLRHKLCWCVTPVSRSFHQFWVETGRIFNDESCSYSSRHTLPRLLK